MLSVGKCQEKVRFCEEGENASVAAKLHPMDDTGEHKDVKRFHCLRTSASNELHHQLHAKNNQQPCVLKPSIFGFGFMFSMTHQYEVRRYKGSV